MYTFTLIKQIQPYLFYILILFKVDKENYTVDLLNCKVYTEYHTECNIKILCHNRISLTPSTSYSIFNGKDT